MRVIEEDRSIGDLFSDLSREVNLLVRQEIALARAETTEKISQVAKHSVLMVVGLALAYAGLLGLIAAAIYGLGTVLPWWASSLIIGGGVFLLGLILVQIGRSNLKKSDLKPRHTIDSIKEDLQWAKGQMK
jgi:hypothetical protein